MSTHWIRVLACAATIPASSWAADASSANAGAVVGLEEVVVTAQRREESAQRAAIAISTISGDQISAANVTRPEGLTSLVPALQATDDTGPYSIFYVRGVGNFAANGLSDPALLFNFDGTAVGRSGTSGFFYDLERVEVLKGPQGTLYGRNATGGAINVISRKPELGQFGVSGSVDYGNYQYLRAEAVMNIPVASSFAMRVAGFHASHDGFMKDGTDDQQDSGARLSLLFTPGDNLTFQLIADYFKQGGQASGGTITGQARPNPNLAVPGFTAADRLGFFSPEIGAYLVTQPNFAVGRTFAPFVNVNHEDNRFHGVSLIADWKTRCGTLTVQPAFRESRLDYASFATGVLLQEQSDERQSSLEARFASNTDQPLRYVAGVYTAHIPDTVPIFGVNQQTIMTFQDYTARTDTQAVFASLTYALTPRFRLTAGARYTRDDKTFDGRTTANIVVCNLMGMFGPSCPAAPVFDYHLTSNVPPNFVQGPDGTITLLTTLDVSGPKALASSYNKLTWRGAAALDLSDHNMLYASAETGYKSGGFFFQYVGGQFKPETMTAYTLGAKNRFLDNRLQLNVELFDWLYHDQQISHLKYDTTNPFTTQSLIFPTENIGQATIRGVEVELQARPVPNTLLSADLQYNDANYDQYTYLVPNQNGGQGNGTGCPSVNFTPGDRNYVVDCSGRQPAYAPRHTLSAMAEQTVPMQSGARLVGTARVHYQSETYTALEFLASELQPGYATWDFDATLHAKGERYFIGAFVNNAFDRTALAFSFQAPLSNIMTATLQHPRVFGMRFGGRY